MSVKADPQKLRDLAKALRAAGDELEQLQRRIMGALDATGWDDRERQRFEAELARDLKSAAAIGRRFRSDHPKTLERKAKALDDFLR